MDTSKKRRKSSDKGVEIKEDLDSPTFAKKQKISEEESRPKSKKELRKERKAALKAKTDSAEDPPQDASGDTENSDEKRLSKAEFSKQKNQRRREEERLQRKAWKEAKEQAQEERFREQDRIRKEKAAREEPKVAKSNKKDSSNKKKSKKRERKSQDPTGSEDLNHDSVDDLAVYKSLFKKKMDPTTGATTCRLGVQYIDTKVGTGPSVHTKSLVTVKYQLRGGSPHGVLLDSSKKFSFRVGKGEVIQGWDIGLEGMQVGGVRNLIVPPKAGYGSQDIGAGPGAMLHFNITLLEIR